MLSLLYTELKELATGAVPKGVGTCFTKGRRER